MKKILSISVALLLLATVWAETPLKLSYQAVIRNNIDSIVSNSNIGMQISILKGSATGTSVYIERFFPTTNSNGLVAIEIGTGLLISGSFTTIDWSTGYYFIKTETDLNGGANYTITGTSQLLSVPYALYAKTDESITGTIHEIDPTYTSSQAANIKANDITNLSNLSGINTGDQDGSETIITPGINMMVLGTGTKSNPYVVGPISLTIGMAYQGGIIFWLDDSGQHGLIAAIANQSAGITWQNVTLRYTGTTGDGLYAGSMNTSMIIATQMADNQTGSFAAKACADYSVIDGEITYGDWYLPSKYELNLLYKQKTLVGGFTNESFWSSTEVNASWATCQDFSNGSQLNFTKNTILAVRAIRAF